MKRGDVVLILFPNSNLISAKARPALVVQRDDLRSGVAQVILATITSQMSRVGHPSRVTQTRAIAAEAESIRASLREMRLAAQRPRPVN